MNPRHIFYRLKDNFQEFWPIAVGFFLLFLIVSYGFFIFHFLEGWSIVDSLYQVVITLSTVGFKEVHAITSDSTKIHITILILLGVGCFAYLIGSFTEAFVEGKLQLFWGKKKMERQISKLTDHFIVCGYGRIGSVVVKELLKANCPTVVVEVDQHNLVELENKSIPYIEGDATSDQVLLRAGLPKAAGVITTLNGDAQNLYVTLTSKQLNPDVKVIARAETEKSISRLEYAGADRVLTPHLLGGIRMAQLVLRPTVTNFLEMAVRGDNLELQMEELKISAQSELVGRNLIESKLRPRFNLIIIAIKDKDGAMSYNPRAEQVIKPEDTLIVVGKKKDLEAVQDIL